MKRIFSFFIVMLLLATISCGPAPKKAAEYNNKIAAEQAAVISKMDSLDIAVGTYDGAQIDISLKNARESVKMAIDNMKKIEDFDGSSEFKDAAINYFKTVQSVLDSEYVEVHKVILIPDSLYGPKEEELFNQMKESYEKRLNESLEKFVNIQQEFAKSYNVEIQ